MTSRFASWWLWLWGAVAVGLLATLFLAPFRWWLVATVVGFGSMEGTGLFAGRPDLPPLTDVIRAYLPGWATFPAIYALVAWAGAKWFAWPHALGVGVLAGLLGWLTEHFEVKYQGPPPAASAHIGFATVDARRGVRGV